MFIIKNLYRFEPFFKSKFFIKLTHWEFWPFGIIYLPVFIYWLFLSVRARSLFFFSAANPGIETGGMRGESKYKILKLLPNKFKPKTLFFENSADYELIVSVIDKRKIKFPIIIKPDVGERGWLVEKINNKHELKNYKGIKKISLLIQEFVDFPKELSVLYYRHPDQVKGNILSVTEKEYPFIIGDGKSAIKELIIKQKRLFFYNDIIKSYIKQSTEEILPKGQKKILHEIGNHCRGSKFINRNYLIDNKMTDLFDTITHELKNIFFCRYDLKYKNIDNMKNGHDVKIFEINGVGSEPAHIYDSNYKLWRAWKDLIKTWNIIYKISIMNKKRGESYMSISEVYQTIIQLYKYKRQV